jgi:hypothetical protein
VVVGVRQRGRGPERAAGAGNVASPSTLRRSQALQAEVDRLFEEAGAP